MSYPQKRNLNHGWVRLLPFVLGAALLMVSRQPARALTLTNYFTQFEGSEGYDTNFDTAHLVGQQGWLSKGSGGNGFTTAFGVGAYIGFDPPGPGTNLLSVWHPVTSPYLLSSNAPGVTFSTSFIVFDSSDNNGNYDSFRWSIYNSHSNGLFSINFDNGSLKIYYTLDDGQGDVFSGWSFNIVNGHISPQVIPLTITMNATSNRWSAFINGTPIITDQPITTVTNSTTLGEVAAEWIIATPGSPGDNFMVFDDYKITDDVIVPAGPQLAVSGTAPGTTSLHLTGQNNYSFAVEATTNLSTNPIVWTPVKTNTISSGFFDVTDTGATGLPRRFYRARWVP